MFGGVTFFAPKKVVFEHVDNSMGVTGMLFRAKAPLRIGFAGGGTDISPYRDIYGGYALNAAINKYAFTSLQMLPTNKIEVHSLDYDYIAHYHVDEPMPFDGQMDLVKAVLRRLKRGRQGLKVMTHNDAPPGSGLGSSSAMVVSLLAAFKEWLSLSLSEYELAHLAYEVERIDLGMPGGQQDQYASAFGGFNFMEFDGDRVLVNPLRIKPAVVNELEYSLMLFYTGKSRTSAHIVEAQIKSVQASHEKSLAAMSDIKQQALDMKRVLLLGDARGFGSLLDAGWESKKQMAEQITNPMIDEMYAEAIKAGALGGKISGAGGGGFMIFYCETGRKHKVAERLEQLGGEVVDFKFEPCGVQHWRVETARPHLNEVVASELNRYIVGETTGMHEAMQQNATSSK